METLTEQGLADRQAFMATEEKPFHFVDSGLDNVYLVGIRYFANADGTFSAEIPAIKQLMRLIARDIVMSPKGLTGKEVRFLRKRLGKKGTEYCRYLGIEPETLSRVENGSTKASIQVQKLAKLSYCAFSEDGKLVECAKSILQSILEDLSAKQKTKPKIVMKVDSHHEWHELQAA
jgi:transcriptional regulator with XRE-family HTH domain